MIYGILIVVIAIIFRSWFTFLPITSGDLSFFFKEQILEYLNPPFLWGALYNIGFGGNTFIHQGLYLFNLPIGILARFFSFAEIERIIWLYPILVIGIISPILLVNKLNLFPSRFYPLTTLIYLLNTYFFMIMGGGQLTVVFGYIAIPVVLAVFICAVESMKLSKILLYGLLFSSLVAFDFRYAYIFLVLVFFYFIFSSFFLTSTTSFVKMTRWYLIVLVAATVITIATQTFWILPYLTNYHNPTAGASSAYISTDAVNYFSFASFSQTFSLLHPLWPENIFGKVGLFKPEFLVLPILAFSSLLFLTKKRLSKSDQIVLFFVILGIIGAFLAKGAKPPLGEIYHWIFNNVPGFVMFRDPTKWYTLVALSYSVLIPFSIAKIYELLKSKIKKQNSKLQFKIKKIIPSLFLLLVIGYLLFLIRPSILGQLGGTYKSVSIPQEYTAFKNFLASDNSFSRVLWVPTMQRFSFYSDTHPAIPGKDYFNTFDQLGVANALKGRGAEESLELSSIKYIVVPDDSQGEIFIKDRKYDDNEYVTTVQKLREIPWLKETEKFGKIIVFSLDSPKKHFWSESQELNIQFNRINPTKYNLSLKNAKKGDVIVFSETYDINWCMIDDANLIQSRQFGKVFNSFVLKRTGNYTVIVSYKPQDYVLLALVITSVSLVFVISFLIFLKYRQK